MIAVDRNSISLLSPGGKSEKKMLRGAPPTYTVWGDCMIDVVDVTLPMDYRAMMACLNSLSSRYDFLRWESLGKTVMGRELPCLRLGTGEHAVLYTGAHHGAEWLTPMLLMLFTEEYCRSYAAGRSLLGYDLSYIFSTRSIYIVPMLNPDGVELAIHGLPPEHPHYEQLLRWNKGSHDFSRWQANARGVDLNHNYNAMWNIAKLMERELGIFGPGPTRYGGEYPESETETAALCRFIRTHNIRLTLAFHSQGEVIYWEYADKTPAVSEKMVEILSLITGYLPEKAEGITACGGCKDWFIGEFGRPGFTVEVGLGENPLPLSQLPGIYERCGELLLTASLL